ncbi:MAG: DJ-1/PfpI family protein [Ferrovibrio sp.]|uniref:DJ-1/PfpI family protein n=1 Tax=Ferrovibrio sp. TaxID=1917215 RepID=UPI002624B366|nr:DJ-1/PfpI family protein [Ferrovibrio sp.]MCW0233277.1 DJ-1/PfpI family protein [Ferrovibrio sp.]
MSLQIGFILFPNLTQLDLTGPWEVFSKLPDATCHLLAPDLQPVKSSSAGLAILPTTTYADCPQLDVVCVPGGPGHLQAMEDAATLDFLKRQAPGCRYVTAVCTGALVLAAAGLLKGYRATTHWMSLERLAAFGATPVAERVVTDRNRVTGGGVTAGIDFGLVLVTAIAGETVAREIQLQIEYEPQPPYGGSPATADPATVASLRGRLGAYATAMAEVDTRAISRLG